MDVHCCLVVKHYTLMNANLRKIDGYWGKVYAHWGQIYVDFTLFKMKYFTIYFA